MNSIEWVAELAEWAEEWGGVPRGTPRFGGLRAAGLGGVGFFRTADFLDGRLAMVIELDILGAAASCIYI